MKIRILAAVVTVAALGLPVLASAGGSEVVLGERGRTGSHGVGWGKPHPSLIDNGGVPSGKAWNLRWSRWGSASATGRGLTWLYRPHGGYYGKPGTIEFRAYRLGQCVAGGVRAYTRLAVRVAIHPGGPLGRWYAWGGWQTTCQI